MNRHSSSFNNGMTQGGKPTTIVDGPKFKQKEQLAVPEGILFCAFRYALGRKTYVVEEVASELRAHRKSLTAKVRTQIIDEINEWLSANPHEIDSQEWARTRDVLAGKPIKEEE